MVTIEFGRATMKCPFPHDDTGEGHPKDFPCFDGDNVALDELGEYIQEIVVYVDDAISWSCRKAFESYVDPSKTSRR